MPGIDYEELKRRISMTKVLDVLSWKPSVRRRSEWRGKCPIHSSKSSQSRRFVVDVQGNRFHCFGCEVGGNHFDLFMKVTKLDIYRAAVELCRRVGVPVPYKPEQRRGARLVRGWQLRSTTPEVKLTKAAKETGQEERLPFTEGKDGQCVWKV
jgi:DNA primase